MYDALGKRDAENEHRIAIEQVVDWPRLAVRLSRTMLGAPQVPIESLQCARHSVPRRPVSDLSLEDGESDRLHLEDIWPLADFHVDRRHPANQGKM